MHIKNCVCLRNKRNKKCNKKKLLRKPISKVDRKKKTVRVPEVSSTFEIESQAVTTRRHILFCSSLYDDYIGGGRGEVIPQLLGLFAWLEGGFVFHFFL